MNEASWSLVVVLITLVTHDIDNSRVWNMDETALKPLPVDQYGWHVKNERAATLQDREFITASSAVKMTGDGLVENAL